MNKKNNGLVLFSGGLDSILVCKILMEQGIRIEPVFFKSYFFSPEMAEKSARAFGLKLRVVDISREHLDIVKKPKFGWGRSMNPCLDCRILMLKKAKEIMEKEGFAFVATGEVLGERPFSQNKEAMRLAEKEASLSGYLLRPLSAKLLEPTIPEKMGWLRREKFFDIEGRSRKRQIELAKKFKIEHLPQPAGGCILTELSFGERLRDLLEKYPEFDGNDVNVLKLGRHFWYREGEEPEKGKKQAGGDWIKIVVARNEEEDRELRGLARKGDRLVEMENYPGPLTLVRNYAGKEISSGALKKAKELTRHYSKKAREKSDVRFKIFSPSGPMV